jgi:hypothetical protein|tara:strand:- start:62 stop:343 length:282 start_codon:yes stop_codon:yes gene_type:complete
MYDFNSSKCLKSDDGMILIGVPRVFGTPFSPNRNLLGSKSDGLILSAPPFEMFPSSPEAAAKKKEFNPDASSQKRAVKMAKVVNGYSDAPDCL